MSETVDGADLPLCSKIARLVQERGWSQDEFARRADLNRLTVRNIFVGPVRKLHHATVRACARALGLTVYDLQALPLEKLLPKMHLPPPASDNVRLLYEQATQPELLAWMESNPNTARDLSQHEVDELLSLQGTGGPLTELGVEHFVKLIERRRKILEQAAIISGTEYVDMLEQFVELLFEKIQPYCNRAKSPSEPGA